MKNRKMNLLFHIFVLALAIVLNHPSSLGDIRNLPSFVVSLVFPLTVFYVCYFWLVPNYLAKKKALTFIVLLLVLLNLITPIGYSILETVHDVMAGASIHLFYRWNMHLSGTFAMTVAAIFGIAFWFVTQWYETRLQDKAKRV